MSENGETLHPIQLEMKRLEQSMERPEAPNMTIGDAIAELSGYTDDGQLEQLVTEEVRRVFRLFDTHYCEFADRTPGNVAAVAFLQGVTFAAAIRNLQEP